MALLTPEELAEELQITLRHVRLLVEQRRIKFVKVGRKVRFDRRDVDRWIAQNSHPEDPS